MSDSNRRVKPAPMLWISLAISAVLAILNWAGAINVSWWLIPYPIFVYLTVLVWAIVALSNVNVLARLVQRSAKEKDDV